MPPTAPTANTARMITIPILITNCTMSVTSTPHRPESVEIAEVNAISPSTMTSASTLPMPKISSRIFTIARLTQPRMMQLIGMPRYKRAKSAQERRGFARVPDLGELDVGHHAGAAPQPGVEEHREHPAHQEAPPDPVPRDAVARDQAGHHERRVGGERRRNHRRAGEPPGNVAPGKEELRRALAGACLVVEADADVEREVGGDDEPVDNGESHGPPIGGAAGT